MQHHAKKIWATTNSNTIHHHAFGLRRDGDSAFCNSRIQANDWVRLTTGVSLVSRADRESAVMNPATFCNQCDAEVKRMVGWLGLDYLND